MPHARTPKKTSLSVDMSTFGLYTAAYTLLDEKPSLRRTQVFAPNGDAIFSLPGMATEGEVFAACHGYIMGAQYGHVSAEATIKRIDP